MLEALDVLERARTRAANHPGDPEAQAELWEAYTGIGRRASDFAPQIAAGAFQSALSIGIAALADPTRATNEQRRKVSESYRDLGFALSAWGKHDDAMAALRAAITARGSVDHTDDDLSWLAEQHEQIATLSHWQGDLTGAVAALSASTLLRERLATSHPDEERFRQNARSTYSVAALILAEMPGGAPEVIAFEERQLLFEKRLSGASAILDENDKILLAAKREEITRRDRARIVVATVTEASGLERVGPGTPCRFLVQNSDKSDDKEMFYCFAAVVCGGVTVYGHQGSTAPFKCALAKAPSRNITARDELPTSRDGTGRMEIDTRAGILRVDDGAFGPLGPFHLEATVTAVY
jgi:tetratricopeptide (TPR) repeat protein